MNSTLVLYYSPGTISLMPHVALLESELPFTAVRVNEETKRLPDGGNYHSINPLGYLPALAMDDGTVLTEAAAIAQYVADRAPARRLAPANGTVERARFQAWLNFLSSELHKGGLGPLFYRGLPESAKDVFRERLRARFAYLDAHLAQQSYLMGSAFTLADAGLYAITSWAPRVGFDLQLYPHVVRHHALLGGRPSVRRVHQIEE